MRIVSEDISDGTGGNPEPLTGEDRQEAGEGKKEFVGDRREGLWEDEDAYIEHVRIVVVGKEEWQDELRVRGQLQ